MGKKILHVHALAIISTVLSTSLLVGGSVPAFSRPALPLTDTSISSKAKTSRVNPGPLPAQCDVYRQIKNSCLFAAAGLGPMRSPLRAPRAGIPSRPKTLPASNWGTPKRYIDRFVTYHTGKRILRELIAMYDVPKPGRKEFRKNHKYKVYVIWLNMGKPKLSQVWKYGITSKGKKRPKSQVWKCEENRPEYYTCTWRWLRTDIRGFYRARWWEATYFANYKRVFGNCPPGARRCI